MNPEGGSAAAPAQPEEISWGLPLLMLVVGAFMAILDSSIVNVAIPALESAMSATTDQIQWVVTVYLLAMGVVIPASGWLGDRLGYRRLYVLSLVVFTAGSFLCGLSWSTTSLVAFRAFQAIGGGMIMPVTMAMVFRLVPPNRVGTAMGFFGVALMGAPAVGPTLGGYLVQYVDWRLIFYVNVPVGILGVLGTLAWVKELPRPDAGRFDLRGFVTAAVGLFALLFALSEAPTYGWTSETIVLLLYVSAAALSLFVYFELTGTQPLLDLRVFRYLQFTLSNVVAVVVSVGLFAGLFYVPLFLQTVVGLGALQTGLLLLPAALVTAALMPISGALYDRVGPAPLAAVGLAVLTVTTFLFHNLAVDTPTATVLLWLVLRSFGMGLAMMPVQTAGMTWIPPDEISRASAVTNILQRVAASFGLAVLTSLLTDRTAAHTAALSAALSPANPALAALAPALAALARTGLSASQVVGALVARQGFVLGIDDMFVVAAAIAAVGILPAIAIRKNPHGMARAGPAGLE
jgi:EmrB/QacA subfamily drug resistance transporter